MALIFISHSSADNEATAKINAWLKGQGFDSTFLDFDTDSGIQPGKDWEQTLYREIERSQAMLILLTKSWVASKWCFAEFAQARALGKAIFPLIETPAGEQLVGSNIQTIDLTSNREGGLDKLRRELTEVALLSPEGFELPKGVSPFPGLAALQEDQAAVFFGRDDDITTLIEILRQRQNRGGARLLALLGDSGSGKSSLLRAGLLPRLKRDKANWITLSPLRPGLKPRDALVDQLLTSALGNHASLDGEGRKRWEDLETGLESDNPQESLAKVARHLTRQEQAPNGTILVSLDQAEELFTNVAADLAADFFLLLNAMLADGTPFVAIFTLRSSYLAALQKADGLTASFEPVSLSPMPVDRIGTVVRGPARIAGIKVDDDLVSALVNDAATPDALPLVAITLNELYHRFGKTGHFTRQAYESLGRRSEGLSTLANTVRARAQTALKDIHDVAALREAFIPALVRINKEGDFVRQTALLSNLPESAHPAIAALVEARLLVRGLDEDEGEIIEVAHEALFRVWPLLAGWLEEEKDFLIGKGRIEQSLADWQAAKETEKKRGLLSGTILDRARDWIIAHPARFADQERAFIQASIAAEQEDLKRRTRLRRGFQGALVATVIVLFAGVGVSTYFFFEQKEQARIAEQQAKRAIEQEDLAKQAQRTAELEAQRANDALEAATETANSLIFDMAQKFRNSGLPNAMVQEILERANDLQDKLIKGNEQNLVLQRSRAVALSELARSLADFGDPEGARKAVEESLEIFRSLVKQEPTIKQFQRDLSITLNRIADITRRSDPDKALALYTESVEIDRALVKQEPMNTLFQQDLSVSLNKIADITRRSDPNKAQVLYTESLEIARALVKQEPMNTGFQRDLSVSLIKIADITRRSDPNKALALYTESLEIARSLVKQEPANTRFQRDLSISLNKIADITQRSDPNKALALYTESLEIARALVKQEPTNTEFQRDLSVSLDKIADITRRSDPNKALALYTESLEITRSLVKQEPTNTEFQRDLSNSLNKIADITLRSDPNKALALYTESLEIRRSLVKQEPINTRFQRDLSLSLERIADITLRSDPNKALALYTESLEIARSLVKQEPTNTRFQRDLSVNLIKIADITQRSDPQKALALYTESLETRRALVKQEPTNTQFQRDLSVSLNKIADITLRSDPDKALALYTESLEIRRSLVKQEPMNTEFQRDLSVSLERIADITRRSDPNKALALYTEILEIGRSLVKQEPTNTRFQRDLSVNLNKIADITQRSDPQKALALYTESLEIRRSLVKQEPNNLQFQTDVVVSLIKLGGAGDAPEQRFLEALDILKALDRKNLLSNQQKGWIALIEKELSKVKGGDV